MAQVKNALRQLRDRLIAPRPASGPRVSVVVPVYNSSQYLRECLDSVLTQSDVAVELVVIDDGSTDESPKILAGYAAADRRVTVLTQANQGQGAARNTAVKAATGEYLFFIDSDDRLPKKALARMVAAAEEHHADIVMGPLARFTSTRKWVPRWGSDLHRSDQYFASLGERPELVRNFYAASKLLRRSFWDAAGGAFREGVVYEDQPLVTRLLIAAEGIVSLADPVYEWRLREDQSSTSQQTHTIADLQARALAWWATLDFFAADATPAPIRTAWLDTVYRTHVHWYLDSASIVEADYWSQLREVVAQLPDLERFLPVLPPAKAFSLELLRDDRHDALVQWRELGAFEPAQQRFVIEAERVFWQPALTGASDGRPRREVALDAVSARSEFLQAAWLADALLVGGRHYLPGLDEAGVTITHHVEVCSSDGAVVAEVLAGVETDAAPFGDGHTLLSYPQANFVARVPVSALGAAGAAATLRVRTTVGEVSLTDPLPAATKWFAASRLGAAAVAGSWLRPGVVDDAVTIAVTPEPTWLDDAQLISEGLELRLDGAVVSELALDEGRTRFAVVDQGAIIPAAELERLVRGAGQITVPQFSLSRADGAGGWVPLRGHGYLPLGRLLLETAADGQMVLTAPTARVDLTEVAFDGPLATLQLTAFAAGAGVAKVWLKSAKGSIPATLVADGTWQLALDDQLDGGYDLWAQLAGRREPVKVTAAPSYLAAVPNVHFVGERRWRCLVSRTGTVHIDARVMPPGPAAAPALRP